jgi:hypothetical protein
MKVDREEIGKKGRESKARKGWGKRRKEKRFIDEKWFLRLLFFPLLPTREKESK